jgi:hypothetical protein
MDYRWPLLYKWGQAQNEISHEDYTKIQGVFRDLVHCFVKAEELFGKNSYLSIYDWAEVHFWPLVTLQPDGSIRCPELSTMQPLLYESIRQSYDLQGLSMQQHATTKPITEDQWKKFVEKYEV